MRSISGRGTLSPRSTGGHRAPTVGNRARHLTDETTNACMVQRPIRDKCRQSGRWIGRIAALALIAVVAASLPAPVQTALAATAVEAETELETLRVGRGDSLSLLLSKAGVRAVDADRISKAIQKRTNLRRMSIGREVRLLFRVEGEGPRIPVAVSVETGKNRYVEATRGAKGRYTAHRTRVPLTRPVPLTEVVLGHDGHKVTVRRNDTLGGILLRHGVDGPTVDAIVKAMRGNFDPRDLMPGHAVTIAAGRDASGAPVLNAIALHLDGDKAVAVVRNESGRFAAQRTTGTALRTMALAPASAPAAGDTAMPPRETGRQGYRGRPRGCRGRRSASRRRSDLRRPGTPGRARIGGVAPHLALGQHPDGCAPRRRCAKTRGGCPGAEPAPCVQPAPAPCRDHRAGP